MSNMNIQLTKFNKDFLETIEGNEEVLLQEDGFYYTFTVDGQVAGVVGYIPLESEKEIGFVQIAVHQDFRGKGLVKLAEEELAKKHDLGLLYATINQEDKASIRAHIKAGFEPEDIERLQYLRGQGLLKSNETRLIKNFK